MNNTQTHAKVSFLKVLLILGPFLLFFLAPIALPYDFFTFRVWEGATSLRLLPFRPFYPNIHIRKESEEGDIAHGTRFAVKRPVEWFTDAYGYRNRTTEENPEVVVIGDSFIVGTGLDQSDIFSEQLNDGLNTRIAALAPGTMESFLNDRRFKATNPKVVIVAKIAEGMRTLPPLSYPQQSVGNRIKGEIWDIQTRNPLLSKISAAADHALKLPGLYFFRASVERQVQAMIQPDRLPFGRISSVDGAQLFSADTSLDVIHDRDLTYLDSIVSNLVSYKSLLENRNIHFVFMPIPSATLVHYDALPEQIKTGRPVFYKTLIDASLKAGIDVIDLEQAFLEQKKAGVNPYQYDDTHWSRQGVATAVAIVRPKVKLLLQRDYAKSK